MDVKSIVLLNAVLTLLVSASVQGDFEFKTSNITCIDKNLTLPWGYTTDETVTVIEWYKQPGVLIARIFGVNTGAPFTVIAPYNAHPYVVKQYIEPGFNAAIKISGVSTNDSGIYSVNVSAVCPQDSTLTFNYTADCTSN